MWDKTIRLHVILLNKYLNGERELMKVIKKESFKDFLAILIAVFQVVWPYILISIGVFSLLMIFLTKIWL